MTTDAKNNKPSRSEIESALGVNQHPSSRKQAVSQNASPLKDLQRGTPDSRRQQVIGGDLTGISRRGSKRSILSRLAEVDYVTWSAVAIVVAILAVFFWPQSSSNAVREVAANKPSEISGYRGEERADPIIAPSQDDSFSKDDDLERATTFRLEDSQQRQVTLLLNAAREHVRAGEYSRPAGNNAVSKFNQVLQIDSNNRSAIEGIEFIRGRFLSNGYEALENSEEQLAIAALEKINAIRPNSDEAEELSDAISQYRNGRKISEFLAQARQAVAADQLILPARSNALFYFQQITEIDPQNAEALEGVKTIADAFVNKANAAIISGDLQAANGYLATVSVIDSEHPSISLLASMIKNAEPLADTAAAGATNGVNSDVETDNRSTDQSENQIASTTTQRSPTTLPRKPTTISNNRTPDAVAREREAFDRRYLQRGLDAYYRGDYDEAAALLQPLADKGVSRAQFRIAYMHFLGRGFDRNRAAADSIIRAALPAVQKFADEGRGWAQSDIGSLYEDGLVLPRDFAEAIYWYRSAAEQGYPGAQTNLGVMYARGRGVTASRKTAVEWFQRAAKQGDIAAKRNLESMGITP